MHENRGITSSWRQSAVFINVPCDQGWSWQNDGASLSVWLNLPQKARKIFEESADENDPDWRPELQDYTTSYPCSAASEKVTRDAHLFSIGTKSLMVEFWADPGAENTVLVRLSQANQAANQVLVSQVAEIFNYLLYNLVCNDLITNLRCVRVVGRHAFVTS